VNVAAGFLGLAIGGPGGLSSFGSMPLIVLLFVAMYFLMVVPNQRKQKAWQTMLSQIKAGDKVTTNGGMRGTVVSVKDDVLIVKTAPDGVKFEIVRSAIAAVTTDEVTKA
jgi:preprotein translocase subunit YajC